MTLVPLSREHFEISTIEARVHRSFSSASNLGITGSVRLFKGRSDVEKEFFASTGSMYDDSTSQAFLDDIVKIAAVTSSFSGAMGAYLEKVHSASAPARYGTEFVVRRIAGHEDGYVGLVTASMLVRAVRDSLFPAHRTAYPSAHWAFTNYHTLNFFTSSTVPADSALVYPSSASAPDTSGFASGSCVLTGAFTIEMFLNPRYTIDAEHSVYRAGTILHLSSCYALSLVTGSSKDPMGLSDGFRLLLQLSHSADVLPSRAQLGGYPNDLVFSSSDNSLRRNRWHHVAVRWPTNQVDSGTGSFFVDGERVGSFVIPSASVCPLAYSAGQGNPDALVVGNYFEGTNRASSAQHLFFSKNASVREGVTNFQPASAGDFPDPYLFSHPLNAELHELRIWNRSVPLTELVTGSQTSVAPARADKGLKFYLPPHWQKASPLRSNLLVTPYIQRSGSTVDAFNTDLAFRVGAHELALENYVRDRASGHFPRLVNLTSSILGVTPTFPDPEDALMTSGSFRKRNLTVLPCDNGRFRPDFSVLLTGSFVAIPESGSILDKQVNDAGDLDLSLVTLSNLLATASMGTPTTKTSSLLGPTHEFPAITPITPVFSRYQLVGESHSKQVSFFDVPQLFYGGKISEGTVQLRDLYGLTGSGGVVKVLLRDDGHGNLYRADAETEHATWSSVGNVLYDEGVLAVKAPTLNHFGKHGFAFSFRGSHEVHVLRVNMPMPGGMFNSSSNASYRLVSASNDVNSLTEKFVYVTEALVLDENLNVVMRTHLAQPLLRPDGERLIVRSRTDW